MKRRIISWMLAAVMVMTSAAVWMGNEKQAEAAASFKVHFIEVGTGDGALLQYGSGKSAKYALIDAGPQTTQLLGGKTIDVSRRVHNYLKKYKIRRLEFIIMTHPHKDHIGGFISILEDRSISVGKVYATQQPVYNHYSGDDDFYSTKTYRTVNELIAERGIPVVVPRMKSSVYLGKAKLTFYSPGRTNFKYGREVDFNSRQVNKFSLVCRITYGKNSFLMTGDTQQESE
ncbi:MBL fold metallo-hydrolase [Anaerostipes caccae]|nr:MBL fold metallo-hydrolase [Anaerostipes caccae]MCB6337220.1 MBL fold metallo-hydrolase [Anaerostipes caccae]